MCCSRVHYPNEVGLFHTNGEIELTPQRVVEQLKVLGDHSELHHFHITFPWNFYLNGCVFSMSDRVHVRATNFQLGTFGEWDLLSPPEGIPFLNDLSDQIAIAFAEGGEISREGLRRLLIGPFENFAIRGKYGGVEIIPPNGLVDYDSWLARQTIKEVNDFKLAHNQPLLTIPRFKYIHGE